MFEIPASGMAGSTWDQLVASQRNLALESIKKVEILEYPELGMEAVWKIEVENFPAFIVMDDKGNDFFDLTLIRTIGFEHPS